jgi:hypothetical protein
MCQRLLDQQGAADGPLEALPEFLEFPLESQRQVDELESHLLDSAVEKRVVSSYNIYTIKCATPKLLGIKLLN